MELPMANATDPDLKSAARWPLGIARRWPVLLPALVVLLIYLPALHYDLVWDDGIFLRDMPTYRDSELWLSALFRPFVLSPNYFRPLALLTFAAELRLGGLNPTLFHLSNLLLHALNATLLTLLAIQWTSKRANAQMSQRPDVLALGGGLLYGLHPALVEGVAFISSRFDLLTTTFLLLALLADVTLRGRRARPILVGLAFLLAALSKEMAPVFVLVLPFWHLAGQTRITSIRAQIGNLRLLWKRSQESGDLLVYVAVSVAGLLYLGLRYLSLGYLLAPAVGNTLPTGSLLQHFLLVVKSIAGYWMLVLWPFTSLAPIHYSDLPVSTSDPAAWIALVAVGLLIAGLVMLMRRTPRTGWLALGGTLALLPVVNLLPLELGGGAFIAERYLLFPLALLVLAAVSLLRPLYALWDQFSWKPLLPLLWLVAGLATVQLTLPNWRDDTSLWTWAARRAPRSATPPTNLALVYVEQGAYGRALEAAQQAIGLDPDSADAWDNVGLALFHLGRYAEAQGALEKAIALQPESALFWNNLAGALREQGELADAEKVLLDQALRLDPHLPPGHLNLGIVYLRADRPDRASFHLQEAARLLPPEEAPVAQALLEQAREPARWLRLGDLLLAHGEFEAAARAFDQASAFGAPMADVAAGLSAALIELQQWEAAAQLLAQALEAAPDDARLYNNLGVVVREQGDVDQARAYFQQAIDLAPDWNVPRENLEALSE